MLEGKRVAVVVPAFDEERLVGETVRLRVLHLAAGYWLDECA